MKVKSKSKRVRDTEITTSPNGSKNNDNPKKVEEPRQTETLTEPVERKSNPFLQVLIWIVIVAGFVGAIIWYLGSSNVGLFRRKPKEVKTESQEEEIPEDIFAINYQKEIDRAAAEGNHRLAIRLMFLRLLKNMTEKNIINYKHDKTNLDYLGELHASAFYTDFFSLTRSYEYSWYGKFPVGERAYSIIKNDFEQLERRL